jgi:Uma2 family endonuclease
MSVLQLTHASPVAYSSLLRRYTLEEFWALPEPEDCSHYELVEGVLYLSPPPDPPHGDVDSGLNRSLVLFLAEQGNPGEVHHPREAIYTETTYLEPDMMYVSSELRSRMGTRRTSADIVFEYTSKGSALYDRTTKADTYLALGVRELWLIDSDARTIEIRYAIPAKTGGLPGWESVLYGPGEWAESRVLKGWRVSVDSLFAGLA